ncbi:MAG: fatty acid desaturase family protein [Maricaulaceae bacterium]
MGATTNYIAKEKIQLFSSRSNLWGIWLVFHVWAVIFGTITFFAIYPNALTFIFAFIMVGARQHGLTILMHDCAHGILFKNRKLNDFVGYYLLGAPYGGDMYVYRKYHLTHHRFTQSEADPDLPLSAKYPLSRASMIRKLLRDMTGMTYLRLKLVQYKMDRGASKVDGFDTFKRRSPWPTLIANAIIFIIFFALGHPWLYLTLWLLPLVTIFFVIIRVRNIAEHALTTRDDNPLTHARTTRANLLARIILAPYWVNYHVEHHAYMYVPCYHLKALHAEMGAQGHHEHMELKPNYLSIFKMAITG